MKKLSKILFVLLVAVLSVTNINFELKGDKVEKVKFDAGIKYASAQYYNNCWWSWARWDCFCDGASYYCAANCFTDCGGPVIN